MRSCALRGMESNSPTGARPRRSTAGSSSRAVLTDASPRSTACCASPLRRIPDERGTIFHMLRADDPHFIQLRRDLLHDRLRGRGQGLAQASRDDAELRVRRSAGQARALRRSPGFADRAARPEELFLGPDDHSLVVIPPELWTGFKGMTGPFAIVANCCTHTRTIRAGRRASTRSTTTIPYDWAVRTPLTNMAEPNIERGRAATSASRAARVRLRALSDLQEHHRRRAARDPAPDRRARAARAPRGADRDAGVRLDDPARVEHPGRVREGRGGAAGRRLRGQQPPRRQLQRAGRPVAAALGASRTSGDASPSSRTGSPTGPRTTRRTGASA